MLNRSTEPIVYQAHYEQNHSPKNTHCDGFEAVPDAVDIQDDSPQKMKILNEYIKTLEQESEQKTHVMKELLEMLESQ